MSYRDSMRKTAFAALTLTLLGALPSHAFRMIQNTATGRVTAGTPVPCDDDDGFAHWTTGDIQFRHNTGNQGSGAATALQNAMTSWNNVTNANHTLTYAGTTTNGWATDGTNTILWADGNGCTGTCLALTALVLQSGQRIVESDITFNDDDFTWRTNGLDFDIQAVASHELGHSLGIHHTQLNTSPQPTMFATYFGNAGRSLEADDRAALQCSQSEYPVTAPPPSGAPSTPSKLTVSPLFCYGATDLSWTASAGASSYQLQVSYSSSFIGAVTIYSGSKRKYFHNGTGTRYYRVRACNGNGCSGWRKGNRSAPYYPFCL